MKEKLYPPSGIDPKNKGINKMEYKNSNSSSLVNCQCPRARCKNKKGTTGLPSFYHMKPIYVQFFFDSYFSEN